MDQLKFIAEVVDSTAWPLATIMALLLFRRPILARIHHLEKFKYKDLQVDFMKEVEELREEAGPALDPLPFSLPQEIPQEDAIDRLASFSPRAAVLESWLLVESAARDALIRARDENPEVVQRLTGTKLIRTLGHREVLDGNSRDLIDRLRHLRNEAVHSRHFVIDEYSAREYAEVALALVRRLRAL